MARSTSLKGTKGGRESTKHTKGHKRREGTSNWSVAGWDGNVVQPGGGGAVGACAADAAQARSAEWGQKSERSTKGRSRPSRSITLSRMKLGSMSSSKEYVRVGSFGRS